MGTTRYSAIDVSANGAQGEAATASISSAGALVAVSANIPTITSTTIGATTGNITTVNATNVDAGASGTAGTVDIFPATASKGKLILSCENQTGNTNVTLKPGAMGQATVITIPDPGAATASVLMTGTSKTAAAVDASLGKADGSVAGVAANYKLARGVTAVTGTQEITSGLATIVSLTAILAEDPSADATIATVVIPTQTGGDAGKATLKVWKPTAADNSAPTAASAAKNVAWIAVGT